MARARVIGGAIVLSLFSVVTIVYPMNEIEGNIPPDLVGNQERQQSYTWIIQALLRNPDPSWPEGVSSPDPEPVSRFLSALRCAERETTIRAVQQHGFGSSEHVEAAAAWWRATLVPDEQGPRVVAELLAQQEYASALFSQACQKHGWRSPQHLKAFEAWQYARYLLHDELYGDFW